MFVICYELPGLKAGRLGRWWVVFTLFALGGNGACDAPRAVSGRSSRPERQKREELVLLDSRGKPVKLFAADAESATVFLFTSTDCPISNRYAPEVRRLAEAYAPRGAAFWLVYPDPDVTPEAIRRHVADFDYPCRALADPKHRLVRRTGVEVTPEAAVYDSNWRLVYRGRIDDRFTDFGQARTKPTTRELQSVLEALARGDLIELPATRAVGCPIPTLP